MMITSTEKKTRTYYKHPSGIPSLSTMLSNFHFRFPSKYSSNAGQGFLVLHTRTLLKVLIISRDSQLNILKFIGQLFSTSFRSCFNLLRGASLTNQNLEGLGSLMLFLISLNVACCLQAIPKRMMIWRTEGFDDSPVNQMTLKELHEHVMLKWQVFSTNLGKMMETHGSRKRWLLILKEACFDFLGDVTQGNALEVLRQVDEIFIQSIRDAGLYDSIWQAFAVFLHVRSVGVQGHKRTHSHVVALRAVTSQDGMTADWFNFEHKFLDDVSRKICNSVQGVNRVVQYITSKPPSTIEWE